MCDVGVYYTSRHRSLTMVICVIDQASLNLLSEEIDLQSIHNRKLFEKYCKEFVGLVILLGDNTNSAVGTFEQKAAKILTSAPNFVVAELSLQAKERPPIHTKLVFLLFPSINHVWQYVIFIYY